LASLLRRAKKAGLIAAVKPFVEQLHANGIYLRQALIDAVLRDVGELS
jgi:predicted nucleic acid-binding protein